MRRSRSWFCLRDVSSAVLVWFVAFSILVGSAQAAGKHPYLPPLHSKENEYLPSLVCGLTTDSQGNTYVGLIEGEVLIYASSGTFLTRFSTRTVGYCNLAIDSTGNVYATNGGINVVKYNPSEFPPTKNTTYSLDKSVVKGDGLIDTGKPVSVAVDPSTQNIYVAEVIEKIEGLHSELVGRIAEYEPDGTRINESIHFEVPHAIYSSIGVYGANHDVYAVDEVHNKIYIFSPAGTIVTTINGNGVNGDKIPGCSEGEEGKEECFGSLGGPPNHSGLGAHLAIEQANGDIYVDDVFGHGVVDQFEASGAFVTMIGPKFGPNNSLIFEDPTHFQAAIAVDDGSSSPNVGNVYVLSQSETGHSASLYAFGPLSHTALYPLSVAEKGSGSGIVNSEPAGIECVPVCSHEYAEGTKVILKATPAPGSVFTGWSSGCEAEPEPEPGVHECEVTMSKPISMVATFSLVQHTLEVIKTGGGSQAWRDTVTSSPTGIECGLACSHAYNTNTKIVLTASAASGTIFTGWSGGGCTGSTTSTCQTTLNTDTTITANFSPTPTSPPPPITFHEEEFFTPSVLSLSSSTIIAPTGKAAPLELTCTGNSPTPCSGELKLTAKIKHGKKTVSQTIAQTPCDIPTGDTRTITIKLNNTATKLLTTNKTLTATLTGPNNLNHTIKLKTNHPTHHKHP
jgi:Divergent InlB B-repeat domain